MKKYRVFLVMLMLLGGWFLSGCAMSPERTLQLTTSSVPGVSPRFLFNMYGSSERNVALSAPMGLAISKGNVYVTDSEAGKIAVFSSDGSLVGSFPALSSSSTDTNQPLQEAAYPVGIAVGEGKVYVSDIRNRRVIVYSQGGKFLSSFPQNNENYELSKPLALAWADGKLYVGDAGDQSIKIFSSSGKLVRQFGQRGSSEGKFLFPNGIAVRDSAILVADSNNSRVQIFDEQGTFVSSLGREATGKLSLPRALAFDSIGRLHVVDTLEHQVSVFDSQSRFLFSYGKLRKDPNVSERKSIPEQELYLPMGIAIDKNARRIYVSDKGYNRISVWEY